MKQMSRQVKWALAAVGAGLIAAAAVAAILLLRVPKNVREALKPENYRRVQVEVSQKQALPETASGMPQEQADASAEPESTVIVTMQKDGDTVFEDGISGKYYFYSRDDKRYALYYDDMYGILEEGKWVEAPANQFNFKQSFDFSCLNEIAPDDLVKKGDYYEFKEERKRELFDLLLSLSQTNQDKYSGCDIRLWIDGGRLAKIWAEYTFDASYYIEQEYRFSYGDIAVTVPQPDERV